jgi:hypothetical protein
MTHTTTILNRHSIGDRFYNIVSVAISSYTASGEIVTASELGVVGITAIVPMGMSSAGYDTSWNGVGGPTTTTTKLVCWMATASAAAFTAATTSANVGTFYLMVIGYGH